MNLSAALRPGLLILPAWLLVACGQAEDGYLPLAGERTLTYAIEQTRSGDTHRHKSLQRLHGPLTVAGESLYQVLGASGPQRLLQYRPDAIVERGYYRAGEPVLHDEPRLLLPRPLEKGSRWRAPMTTRLLEWRKHSLEKAGRGFRKTVMADFECETTDATVRTPVGTFDNVARVSATARQTIVYGSLQEQSEIQIRQTQWYAPGIGLIKSQRREFADSREFNPGESTTLLERID